jgi:DNA-binding transcriptional ArsR family regulator
MSEASTPPAPVPFLRTKAPDVVFAALGDPVRRQILCALAGGQPQTATQLMMTSRRRLDATLKHLVVLREAGMVETIRNPGDARRQLYRLAVDVKVTATPGGREIDFGCCLVRL